MIRRSLARWLRHLADRLDGGGVDQYGNVVKAQSYADFVEELRREREREIELESQHPTFARPTTFTRKLRSVGK